MLEPGVRYRRLGNSIYSIVFCLASLCAQPLAAAEEELLLLRFEGDHIGKIESLDTASDSESIISAYYELLTSDVRAQINILRSKLSELVPDYVVAFTAADSAEITQVKSDMNVLWANIHSIHSGIFTEEVVELLNDAYVNVYALVGLDR